MKQIRFSHNYDKLLDGNGNILQLAELLEVFLVNIDDLHEGFIDYDSLYFDKTEGEYKHFPLPKTGKYMVLLFEKIPTVGSYFLFTTIRRYTAKKYEYYKNARGEWFEIVITSD